MATKRLTLSPLTALYGKSALELALVDADELESRPVGSVVSWVALSAKELGDELKEPTNKVVHLEQEVRSLLELATQVPDLKKVAPGYDVAELEETAAVFVSMLLLHREAPKTVIPLASSAKGEAVAVERGWKTLKAPQEALEIYREELTIKGKAILQDYPSLLAVWLTPKADGSFAAALESVQLRLDLVREHAALFTNTLVDAELLEQGKKLIKDAKVFFRGREGRDVLKQQMTLARDQAFTLLLPRLERLRNLLHAAYYGRPELKKIDGEFWKRLSRMGRSRRPRGQRATKKPELSFSKASYATASD